MRKNKDERTRTCGECIHEYACAMWNVGSLHNTDATNCSNYETAKMSAAYLIGKMDGEKASEEKETEFKQVLLLLEKAILQVTVNTYVEQGQEGADKVLGILEQVETILGVNNGQN